MRMRSEGESMARKNKFLIIFLSVSIICIIFACAPAAFAHPDRDTYHEGTVACESVVKGGENTVLEKLDVEFSYPTILKKWNKANAEGYNGSVKSEYLLYNPSQSDDSARLWLRYGDVPPYFYGEPQFSKVYVDGAELSGKTRYGISYSDDEGRRKAADVFDGTFAPDDFVNPDDTVYLQTFVIVANGRHDYASCIAEISGYDGNLPLIGDSLFVSVSEKRNRIYYSVENSLFTVATVGSPLGRGVSWRVAEDTSDMFSEYYDDKKAVHLIDTQTMTYEEYIRQNLGEYADEEYFSDLYASVTCRIYDKDLRAFRNSWLFDEEIFITWKEYEIAVPAGERVSLGIEEPFFPDINENMSPDVYNAEYRILEFRRAAEFGVNAKAYTPYYVLDRDNCYFTKADDGGYVFIARDYGEDMLKFGISISENPKRANTVDLSILVGILMCIFLPIIFILMIMLGLLSILLIPVGIVFGIIVLIKSVVRIIRKRRDKNDDIFKGY